MVEHGWSVSTFKGFHWYFSLSHMPLCYYLHKNISLNSNNYLFSFTNRRFYHSNEDSITFKTHNLRLQDKFVDKNAIFSRSHYFSTKLITSTGKLFNYHWLEISHYPTAAKILILSKWVLTWKVVKTGCFVLKSTHCHSTFLFIAKTAAPLSHCNCFALKEKLINGPHLILVCCIL